MRLKYDYLGLIFLHGPFGSRAWDKRVYASHLRLKSKDVAFALRKLGKRSPGTEMFS